MARPVNIYFATHKTCNLNCEYCYLPFDYTKTKKHSDDEIILGLKELIKKIEDEDYYIDSFCFHGAEPALLSPEALAAASNLVAYHKQLYGMKPFLSIQSNGINFTRDYLKRLRNLLIFTNSLKLGFSIDPPKEVHDLLRNHSYDTVIENYNTAKEMGFTVSVLSVISKATVSYLDEFGDWIKKELEQKEKTGNPHKIKAKVATGSLSPDNNEMKKIALFLIENELDSLLQLLTPGYCLHAGNECEWYEFDIDGNCYSCNKSYMENGIFANWKNEHFDVIINKRKKLFQNYFENPECHSCAYEMLCNSGCPVDRIKEGSDSGKAHECTIFKTILDNKLESGISLAKLINSH